MIKLYSAFTNEIDHPQAAAQDILAQLKPEQNMQKNTVGILHFYYEFSETGAYQAVKDALPFPVAGCISSYIGTSGQSGDAVLSVMMITGDDICFDIQTVENAGSKSREQIDEEIGQIFAAFCSNEKPKLVMPFLPQLGHFSGSDLVAAVNMLPQNLPLFGTVTFNSENVADSHHVLGGGKISSDMLAFVAFYGEFEPKFRLISSFAFYDGFGEVAEVTDAEGSILKKVNGISALKYLKKQGMIAESGLDTLVPAILTYPDGTKVVRGFFGVTEGTENIVAAGNMEVGTKIMFADLNGEKTLASTEKLFKEVTQAKENGVIAYSCAARAWSLGSKFYIETQKIAECAEEYQLKNAVPLDYCVAYSGGEICPVYDDNGNMVNVLHNYTLISCALC